MLLLFLDKVQHRFQAVTSESEIDYLLLRYMLIRLQRKNWRSGFRLDYSQASIQSCIVSNASTPQQPVMNSSH